ncbi:Glycosyltransferase involved in cell wall bisynthesis [Litoreibacter albidus]|uniref:Glycosyltransferase involved in cell wall bisynthesis n=2 Tax=Litoreibacter albidus TaxID=670155 RepID=A0A1H3DLT9_9RHOB|nr:Glycosyltransferase involved in cell wall bisynthesis [Litoreibacter albidus]
MKVLLTHRFFWPDTAPYAVMLRTIGDALAEAGHEVHILSSMPSYRTEASATETPKQEKLGALNVRRIWVFSDEKCNPLRRLANAMLYCWALFVKILYLRPNVVTASTFPPVMAAWSASLAARIVGAKFIYHIQDIHPELSVCSGGRMGRGATMRLLRWLDNQTLRRSEVIVTLSEDMAETLRARGLGPLPITLINNPALDSDHDPIAPPPELIKPAGTTRVIFAGNLGRFQNLPLLAEGIAQCFDDHPELELMFLGDGVALAKLKARWKDHPQVRFAPFLPFAQARGIISGADIGLVSLSANIYRVAYPSKVSTYLDLGLRILALVEPESQMARELEQRGLGAVPSAANPEAIATALETLLAAPPSAVSTAPERTNWPQIVAELAPSRKIKRY